MKKTINLLVIIFCFSALGLSHAKQPDIEDDWKSENITLAPDRATTPQATAFWGTIVEQYGTEYQGKHLTEKAEAEPMILDELTGEDKNLNLMEMALFDYSKIVSDYSENVKCTDFSCPFVVTIPAGKKLRDEYPNRNAYQCLWSVEEWDPQTTTWKTSTDFSFRLPNPSNVVEKTDMEGMWLSQTRITAKNENAFGKFLLITARIQIKKTNEEGHVTDEIIKDIRNVFPAVIPKFERSLTFNHSKEYNSFQIDKDSTNTLYMDGCNIDSEFNKNGQNHPFASPEYPACHDAAKRNHIGILYRINTPALVKLTMNAKPKELGHISFKLKVPENSESILSSCSKVELFKEADKVTHDSSDEDKQVLKLEKKGDIIPAEAKETTYYFSTQLASHVINKGDIKWNWQFNIGPKQDDKEPVQKLMKELQFQPICDVPNVYVVLEEPLGKPWAPRTKGHSPDRDENHNLLPVQERETYSDPENITPWFGALNFAIVSCQTKGRGGKPELISSEIPEVLNTIGDYLFCKHGVSYDHWIGQTFYLNTHFNLNGYINKTTLEYRHPTEAEVNSNPYLIRRIHKSTNSLLDWSKIKLVNCVDQANALSLTSRLLGMNTGVCVTKPYGWINTCYLVGGVEVNNPFFENPIFDSGHNVLVNRNEFISLFSLLITMQDLINNLHNNQQPDSAQLLSLLTSLKSKISQCLQLKVLTHIDRIGLSQNTANELKNLVKNFNSFLALKINNLNNNQDLNLLDNHISNSYTLLENLLIKLRSNFSMHCYTVYPKFKNTLTYAGISQINIDAIDACSGPTKIECFHIQAINNFLQKSIEFSIPVIDRAQFIPQDNYIEK